MSLPIWEGQAITNIGHSGGRRFGHEGQRHQQSQFPRGFSVVDPTSNIRAPNARILIPDRADEVGASLA
jgi:hypothetical protein